MLMWIERESVVSTFFSSQSKRKRDRDQNVAHSLRDRENLQKTLERKVDSAVRGERMAQQKLCTKLKLKLRREIEKNDVRILLFRRSIKNLNLNYFNYIKQVKVQIRLKEIKSACMEKWNCEKILHEIAKKLKK